MDSPAQTSFRMPEFCRTAWVSDEAAQAWKPRLERIHAAWREIEWRSVKAGIRRAALAAIGPEELPEFSKRCAREGLSVLPLALTGGGGQFRNRETPLRFGEPIEVRAVVAGVRDTARFADAWDARNDVAVGRLLGYPPCCTRFFREHWARRKLFDTTWPMACNSVGDASGSTITLPGVPETNILCRWIGARLVPHLPCSMACEGSIELGRAMAELGRAEGYGEEMGWAEDVLNWPAEWSALNGIAIIKLPVVKITASTDMQHEPRVLRLLGSKYPSHAARGLGFPYQRSKNFETPHRPEAATRVRTTP